MRPKRTVVCLICEKQYTNSSSVCTHIKNKHSQTPHIGTNWNHTATELTNNKGVQSDENRKRDARCLHCGIIRHSRDSIYGHIKSTHHAKPIKQDEDYVFCDPVSSKHTLIKNPRTKQIITPETKYLEIQATIRIPISFGAVQIIPIEEK